MTLHPKRTIDSARGSLPGRKLPTAERWCWDRPAGPIGIYLLSSIIYLLSSDSRNPIGIPLSASQTPPFYERGTNHQPAAIPSISIS